SDREPGEPLEGGQLLALLGDSDPDHVGDVQIAALLDLRHFRSDQGDERALPLQDGDLLDVGALGVNLLDLFREDVLATAEDDQLLGTAGDVEVTVNVEMAEIAGTEPAILGERFGVGFIVVAVAGEDARSLELDLAPLRTVSFDLRDPDLAVAQGPAFAAVPLLSGPVTSAYGCCFRLTIAVEHFLAESLQLQHLVEVETRALRYQQPMRRADRAVQ